jgi:hypothetical protein
MTASDRCSDVKPADTREFETDGRVANYYSSIGMCFAVVQSEIRVQLD